MYICIYITAYKCMSSVHPYKDGNIHTCTRVCKWRLGRRSISHRSKWFLLCPMLCIDACLCHYRISFLNVSLLWCEVFSWRVIGKTHVISIWSIDDSLTSAPPPSHDVTAENVRGKLRKMYAQIIIRNSTIGPFGWHAPLFPSIQKYTKSVNVITLWNWKLLWTITSCYILVI